MEIKHPAVAATTIAVKDLVLADEIIAQNLAKKIQEDEKFDRGLLNKIHGLEGELLVTQGDISATNVASEISSISDIISDMGSLLSTIQDDIVLLDTLKAAKKQIITTTDAVDLTSALTLVNELKAKVNSMNS